MEKRPVAGHTKRRRRRDGTLSQLFSVRPSSREVVGKTKTEKSRDDISRLADSAYEPDDGSLETFDELMDDIHAVSKVAGDEWSPKKPEERQRVWHTDNEEIGRAVWAQQMMRLDASREDDDVSAPTGVLMTAGEWQKLGGSLVVVDKPIIAMEPEHIAAIQNDEDVPDEAIQQSDVVFDYADISGVDPYELLNLPPPPFNDEIAGEVWSDLNDIADELGLEVIDEPPQLEPENLMYPVVSLHAIGVYKHGEQEIAIHPALPPEHKALTLLHEIAHAHDFPQHSAVFQLDEMTHAQMKVDTAKCELVAEMTTFAVLKEMGGQTSGENVVAIRHAESTLMRLGEYDTENRKQIGARVAATKDFIQSRLTTSPS